MRSLDFSAGSASFSTLVTGSPTCTAFSSSSDLDTEVSIFFSTNGIPIFTKPHHTCYMLLLCSWHDFVDSLMKNRFQSTESLFHDNGITLGSLIGVSSIFNLSRRSSRGRIRTVEASQDKKNCKSKHWLFSLCSKLTPEAVNVSNAPSLGHFLEAERRGRTNINRRNHGRRPIEYGPDDFSPAMAVSDDNGLFVDGVVAAAQGSSASENADHGGTRSNSELLEYGNRFRTPLLVSCLCGQLIK